MDIIKVKNGIRERLILILSDKIKEAQKLFESAKQAMIEAPGRNQARYDSSREEFGNEAAQFIRKIEDIKNEIEVLRNFNFCENKKVETGTIFKLSDKEDFYFIFSLAGGEFLEKAFEDKNIFVITDKSPLGILLQEKIKGEKIVINGKEKIIKELV